MRGLVSVDEVMAALPKARREGIEARGAELLVKIRERMTLAELRKRRKLSQAAIAEALGVGQAQISRLEQREDPRLSTIQRTIAAMGGSLTMIVTFPDQEPLVLTPIVPAPIVPAPIASADAKKNARSRSSTKKREPLRKQGEPRSGSHQAQA